MIYARCLAVAIPWVAACTAPGPALKDVRAPPPPSIVRSPLALSCVGCHQPQVDSPLMRALDNQAPRQIVDSLRRSRDAQPAGSIMARFTAALTDAQIDELASQLGRRQSP